MINYAVTLESTANQDSQKCEVNFDVLMAAACEGVIELDEAADMILASLGELGRRHGTYSDYQLTRKCRNEQRRLHNIDTAEVSEDVITCLLEKQIDDLVDVGRLTPLQEICFRLSAAGFTAKDMAATLGLKPRRIEVHLRIARRKIRTAYDEGNYAGWYEVYLSEVRRTRKP